MTYKEFRETAHGISEYQAFLVNDFKNPWRFGEEAVSSDLDHMKVPRFDLTTNMNHDIVCIVDLI